MLSGAVAMGLVVMFATPHLHAEGERIQMLGDYSLSPDGDTIVFSWAGDIWRVSSRGGTALPITRHPAADRDPRISPDGKELAFISDRDGTPQIYTMPLAAAPFAAGTGAPGGSAGAPVRRTSHSEGYSLVDYFPDGSSFLARGTRDHYWRDAGRYFRVSRDDPRAAEELLLDVAGSAASLSPDGNRLLFMREGATWFRKGYHGSQAGQIWLADLERGTVELLLKDELGYRFPRWSADGQGFYYVGQQSGSFELYACDAVGAKPRRLTHHKDDMVYRPVVSRDGSTIVYRHLFDLYVLRPGEDSTPHRLDISNGGDPVAVDEVREMLSRAQNVSFSSDALEIAFVSGGDVWVMDTELREPRQVTDSPEEEREPLFSPDGESIWYISDRGGECDIWRAERADEDRYWWQNDEFRHERVTNDDAVESDTRFSPDGEMLAYIRGNGDLMVMDADGEDSRRLLESWGAPSYSWSPDSKWLAYAVDDNDFNRDVWIQPLDGSRARFNVSTHPDNDFSPKWSPDGRLLAFTGRRSGEEVDIYYVYLRAADEEEGSRDRKLEKALEKMKKARKKKGKKKPARDAGAAGGDGDGGGVEEWTPVPVLTDSQAPPASQPAKAAAVKGPPEDAKAKKDDGEPEEEPGPEVVIDFEGLRDRIHRISNPDSREGSLVWIGDEKLAFSATVGGSRATYTVEFPDSLKPKKLSSTTFSGATLTAGGKKLAILSGGVPATLSTSNGKVEKYSFRVRHRVDPVARQRAAFVLAWRTMRDNFYDERLGNRNWGAIRRKYEDAAARAVDSRAFATVVQLMLGELNGSHLGFWGGSSRSAAARAQRPAWSDRTAHLGVRFDPTYKGPGWRVRDVLEEGPADSTRSHIESGEVILAVDGVAVDPSMAVSAVLNGDLERDIALRVRGADGEEREVALRPISYGAARRLLYPMWVRANQRKVEKLAGGTLGYLHIRGMNWSSFLQFEEELYKIGAGKQGLLIDVRANGGGFTTDHLLTVLCQPSHAITVPRGGGPGYPQDRLVYASWHKPIVVLCDQDSFSNAEIFSHAIKNLGRGHLVGVPTAGGVISTGGRRIMGMGFLRMPFRGWYLERDGEDMELNGAVPDFVLWPEPGELPAGRDRQLEKAVEVLQADVAEWKARPRPHLRKASERSGRNVPVDRSERF